MNNFFQKILALGVLLYLTSCISLKDIQLIQPDEKLKLDSKGMIEYNMPEYYIQKDDMVIINISTVSQNGMGILSDYISSGTAVGGNKGVLVREDGNIELPRIGKIHLEGLTIKQAREKIQGEFYKIYTPEGTYIDVNLAGIEYILVGEAGSSVQRVNNNKKVNLLEVFARSGSNNIYADFKNVRIIRTTPNGTNQVHVDVTKESIMNSEYFWVQNNDIIVVNPRKEKVWGIGLNPLSVVTTTIGVLGTILGVYLFFDRF